MKMTYDKKTDSLYLRLQGGAVKKTKEIGNFCMADINSRGDVIGLEILSASRLMAKNRQTKKMSVCIGNQSIPLYA